MHRILSALAVLMTGLFAMPALAQSNAIGPSASDNQMREMLPNFDIETIAPVLSRTGAQVQQIDMAGTPALGVKHRSGAVFILSPTACNKTTGKSCAGLQMIAIFNYNVDPVTANTYNKGPNIAKISVSQNEVLMYHYIIADYGMPAGNLAITSDVFASNIIQFLQFRTQNMRTVSFEPLLEDENTDEQISSTHELPDLPAASDIPRDFVNTNMVN